MNTILIAILSAVVVLLFGFIIMDKSKTRTIKRKREKPQYSKVIVAFVIVLNVLFTLGILYVFLQTGSEPTVLVGCWFAFTTGELWLLASIKKSKVKNEEVPEKSEEDIV